MTDFDNIPRVAAPSQQKLVDYIEAERPVIFAGLFAGRDIAGINTYAAALDALGDVVLEIRPEYSSGGFETYRRPASGAPLAMTFRDYATLHRRNPTTPLMCVEQETPPEVASLVTDFPYAGVDGGGSRDRLRSRFFAGHSGNRANLHYDRDYHATLLYQVAGRKRVVCISPRQSQKLRPMTNFSEYLLGNFTELDRLAFLRYTDAHASILHPGETLLIPAAHWHHIDYLDDAISLNFKLPRNRYLAVLGGGLFHCTYLVQAIATKLRDGGSAQADGEQIIGSLIQLYLVQPQSPIEKFAAIDHYFRRVYAAICIDYPQTSYFGSFPGTEEIDLWRDKLDAGELYSCVP